MNIFTIWFSILLFVTNIATACEKEEAKTLLLEAIYHEAEGEGFKGMLAVGTVIAERKASSMYGKTFCEVINKRRQFSYKTLKSSLDLENVEVSAQAIQATKCILSGCVFEPVEHADHYFACEGRYSIPPIHIKGFIGQRFIPL